MIYTSTRETFVSRDKVAAATENVLRRLFSVSLDLFPSSSSKLVRLKKKNQASFLEAAMEIIKMRKYSVP
jgi:hypothetical protein